MTTNCCVQLVPWRPHRLLAADVPVEAVKRRNMASQPHVSLAITFTEVPSTNCVKALIKYIGILHYVTVIRTFSHP